MAVAAAALLALMLGAAAVFLFAEREDSATFGDEVDTRRQRQAAVLFSGDAGFLGVGPEIARTIEGLGLPVYGVSSLAEFRERRTISQTVAIVNQAVRVARARFDADRILLVGHSFGSDVIGTALPDLAPDVRRALVGAVLIVPTDNVYLRADPTGLSYRGPPDAQLARVQSVNWLPMLCIQGQQEPDSLCPKLRGSNVTAIALPGGHGLRHDEAQLAAALDRAVTPMLGPARR